MPSANPSQEPYTSTQFEKNLSNPTTREFWTRGDGVNGGIVLAVAVAAILSIQDCLENPCPFPASPPNETSSR